MAESVARKAGDVAQATTRNARVRHLAAGTGTGCWGGPTDCTGCSSAIRDYALKRAFLGQGGGEECSIMAARQLKKRRRQTVTD